MPETCRARSCSVLLRPELPFDRRCVSSHIHAQQAIGAAVARVTCAAREVLDDLSLPGYPEVLALGDMIRIRRSDGSSTVLPGLAPVAMQEGLHAARVVRDRLRGRPSRRFRYRDKGRLATIGRASAVAEIKGIHLSGFVAWVTWLIVHLWYLIGFENRLLVLIRWVFSFLAHGRGARLITAEAQAPNTECLHSGAGVCRPGNATAR